MIQNIRSVINFGSAFKGPVLDQFPLRGFAKLIFFPKIQKKIGSGWVGPGLIRIKKIIGKSSKNIVLRLYNSPLHSWWSSGDASKGPLWCSNISLWGWHHTWPLLRLWGCKTLFQGVYATPALAKSGRCIANTWTSATTQLCTESVVIVDVTTVHSIQSDARMC